MKPIHSYGKQYLFHALFKKIDISAARQFGRDLKKQGYQYMIKRRTIKGEHHLAVYSNGGNYGI